jgi:predicted O-methyltransferase YrrM
MKGDFPMKSLIVCATLFFSSILGVELRPFPWLTEGAIAYLDEYLAHNPQAKILEFGSGGSTVWFAQRSASVTSIEHDLQWYGVVKGRLSKDRLKNVNLVLKTLPYYSVCKQLPSENFDLILVDGRNRKACILYSIPLLKKGGVLMLDDAQRPYYRLGTDLLESWRSFSAVQLKPDVYGYSQPEKVTRWWIKP